METVGSTSDVAIIAQLDFFFSLCPLCGVKRYLITKDDDTHHITSPVLWSQDEINMSAPVTLVDFVKNSTQDFPAEHYALILWNHGLGFRGVCYDNDLTDELNMTELESALSKIENDTGVTFDLIGFDACLMGELEVAYQVKDYAQSWLDTRKKGIKICGHTT